MFNSQINNQKWHLITELFIYLFMSFCYIFFKYMNCKVNFIFSVLIILIMFYFGYH